MSRRAPALLLLVLAACTGQSETPPLEPVHATDANVRVVNATQGSLDVLVDGVLAARALPIAGVSELLPVASGARRVQLRTATGATTELAVTASADRAVTALVTAPTASALAAAVLADTGGIVPAGKTKLRVTHLAAGPETRFEIFRTQPDYQQPIRISTPFPYGTTSPYLQSDAGSWEVWVSPFGSTGTTKLATSGPIAIPTGERRTVVLLDSAGVLRFRVLRD